MSADNWTICPRCKAGYDAARKKDQDRVAAMYGKEPREKYLEAVKALENPPILEATLREDFWQGVDKNGVYSCNYRCSCPCGFSFKFEHKQSAFNPT